MTDERFRETQQELFEEFSPAPKKAERFPSIAKTHKPILFSTTLEQLLMVGIIGILALCGVFFLGVLRGKALRQPPAVRTAPVSTLSRNVPVPRGVLAAPARPVTASETSASNFISPTEKPYTIQIVTHRKKELAEAEVARIKKLGYVSFIIPSGEYFQVCAGQYTAKEDAKKDLALFSARYKDCFLRHR